MPEAEAMLGLQEQLSTLVVKKFRAAYEAKDIVFSDTSVAILKSNKGASVGLIMAIARLMLTFLVSIAILSGIGEKAFKQWT